MLRYHRGVPGEYTLKYVRGKVVREGRGLSLLHCPLTSTVMSVSVVPTRQSFKFLEITEDMHEVVLEGDVVFGVANPRRAAFTLGLGSNEIGFGMKEAGRFVSSVLRDIARDEIQRMRVEEVIKAKATLGRTLLIRSRHSHALRSRGLGVSNVFIQGLAAPEEAVRALRHEKDSQAVVGHAQPTATALPAFRPTIPQTAPLAEQRQDVTLMECSEACPFRFVCEDYMRDFRGGRAVCSLFREFDM